MSPSRRTPPPVGELRIDWGRAVFAGSVGAGVLWATIVKITSVLDAGWPIGGRMACAVALVCVPVAMIGVVSYRRARTQPARTRAVATIIIASSALMLPLLLVTSGALEAVVRR